LQINFELQMQKQRISINLEDLRAVTESDSIYNQDQQQSPTLSEIKLTFGSLESRLTSIDSKANWSEAFSTVQSSFQSSPHSRLRHSGHKPDELKTSRRVWQSTGKHVETKDCSAGTDDETCSF